MVYNPPKLNPIQQNLIPFFETISKFHYHHVIQKSRNNNNEFVQKNQMNSKSEHNKNKFAIFSYDTRMITISKHMCLPSE